MLLPYDHFSILLPYDLSLSLLLSCDSDLFTPLLYDPDLSRLLPYDPDLFIPLVHPFTPLPQLFPTSPPLSWPLYTPLASLYVSYFTLDSPIPSSITTVSADSK